MSPKELRAIALDLFVTAVGVVALVVNGAYRRWWVSAIVAALLWLQVALSIQRRQVQRALDRVRELEALSSKAPEDAGSSE